MKTITATAGGYRRHHSTGAAAAALAVAALVVSGCAPAAPTRPGDPAAASSPGLLSTQGPGAAAPPPTPATSPAVVPSPSLVPAPATIQVGPATPPAATPVIPAPTSLTVAGTAIDMPVVPGGVSAAGAMEIPDVFDRAAWYRFGPAPGAAAGTAVIAGHIDTSSDRAPFSALKSLPAGTQIRVGRGDAPALTYRVVRVELMEKDRFDGASLFRRSGPHELKLVTCGGRWLDERMDYSDNVIVTAVPA